jgi:hypothetical protein
MDVSYMFWDFIYIVSNQSLDDIKNNRIYQVFECASFLNREFILDECKLINWSYVSQYPKGVSYTYYDACYHFPNIHSLMYSSADMLCNSYDFNDNPDAQDKYDRIIEALKILKEHDLIDDLTSHLSKLKLTK